MAEVRSRDEGASDVQSGVRPDHPPLAANALILLPVRNTVLFPGVVMPLAIERERSIAAVQAAVRDEKPLGVILQTDSAIDEPGPEHLFTVGTVAEVLRYVTGADGVHHVICRGVRRFRVIDYVPGYP